MTGQNVISYLYFFLLKLKIVPEAEVVHGSHIKTSDLTSLWLFAKNAEVLIQRNIKEGENYGPVFYKLSVCIGYRLCSRFVLNVIMIVNCLLLKLYRKFRKCFWVPEGWNVCTQATEGGVERLHAGYRRKSNPQPSGSCVILDYYSCNVCCT